MQDTLRRFAIAAAILAVATGAIYMLHFKSDNYSFFDFIKGESPPRFQSEEFTLEMDSAIQSSDVPALAALNQEIAKLTSAVTPAVVSIETSAEINLPSYVGALNRPRYGELDLGSGVIVSREGHVLTNYHVVRGKSRIRVKLSDAEGRSMLYPAIIIGSTQNLDIAVLKIQSERKDFTALKLGDSDRLNVGELVFAVGNPYGLQETVTQGNISALDRRISDGGPTYLQTSAPINPGNSGGPLVNIYGDVIGINSIVVRGTGKQAAQGIGFAIPANDAAVALQAILEKGAPVLGYVGLAFSDIPAEVRARYPDAKGVFIDQVFAGSPAEKAGIKPHDMAMNYNGQEILSKRQLARLIHRSEPGERVEIVTRRRGEVINFTLNIENLADQGVVAERPEEESSELPQTGSKRDREFLRHFGVQVGPLFSGSPSGVKVESVRKGGKAALFVEPGDFITAVNETVITTPAEFNRAVLRGRDQKLIELRVIRSGRLIRAVIEPPF